METRIILIDKNARDSRKQAELLANKCFLPKVADQLATENKYLQVYTLEEFMETCNQGEIQIEDYCLSYINV